MNVGLGKWLWRTKAMAQNMLNDKTIKIFYEQEAADYDLKRWATSVGRYIDAMHKKTVLTMIEPCAGKKILEVGIGTGRFSVMMKTQGANVTGLDFALPMLKIAKDRLEKTDGNSQAKMVNADVKQLPFQDSSFDGCIGINIFSHLPECIEVIKEISRVLKPGGFLVANFPNLLSYYFPYGALVNLLRKSLRRNVYTKWYTLPQIRNYCSQAGLRLDTIEGHTSFPFQCDMDIVLAILRAIDRMSKITGLRNFGPVLFVKCIKQ